MAVKPLHLILLSQLLLSTVSLEVNAEENSLIPDNPQDSDNTSSTEIHQTEAVEEPLTEENYQLTSNQKPDKEIWIPQDSDLRILEIRVESYVFDDVIGA
ncbi:MAG: hypothetical protein OEM07_03625, partial [Gammaproteobacteria bacterium]|nr:hypothetical protein [Gammaproteobacteria bacterium]